jgi:signal transduction histidine kinase
MNASCPDTKSCPSNFLNAIDSGLIAVDLSGQVVYHNHQLSKLTGCEPPQGKIIIYTDYFQPGYSDSIKRSFEKAASENRAIQLEIYMSAESRWIEVEFHPFAEGTTILVHEISIQKQAEEKVEVERKLFQKQTTAAVIKAQEQDRAHVSLELHDNVNQVLTTIKLYTELAMRGEAKESLLGTCMTLLQKTITDIRTLSKKLSAPTLGKIHINDSIHELVVRKYFCVFQFCCGRLFGNTG